MTNQPIVLLCFPCDTPGYVPGALHTSSNCNLCGREVWIGPVQKEHQRDGGIVVCVGCAIRNGVKVGDVQAANPNEPLREHDQDAMERAIERGWRP